MKLLGKKTKFIRPKTKTKTETSFLIKLYTILKDKNYSKYIYWSKDGKSFIIANSNDFTKHVLPKFFSHQKFSSFVRQLNLYNFHKVKTKEKEEQKYTHKEFSKDKTIEQIKSIKKPIKPKIDDKSNQNIEILDFFDSIKTDEPKKNEYQNLIENSDMSNITNQKKIFNYLLDNSIKNNAIQQKIGDEINNLIQLNNNLMEQIQLCNNKLIYQNENNKKMKALAIFLVILLLKKINKNKAENIIKNNINRLKQTKTLFKFIDKYVEYKENQKNINIKNSICNLRNSIIEKNVNFNITNEIFQDYNNINEFDPLKISLLRSAYLDFKNSRNRNNISDSNFDGNECLRQSRNSRYNY
jgi:hypothetical protein